MIRLKRAYEEPSPTDGFRVLVERLCPRGVRKEALKLDLWLKEIAPSAELRRWFHHDREKWAEFQKRYRSELSDKQDLLALLRERLSEGTVTFVYASADETCNSARVLKGYLDEK